MVQLQRHGLTHGRAELDCEIIASLPDRLVAIMLDLQRLSYGDAPQINAQAALTIGDCCDRLHAVMSDVLRVARDLDPPSLSQDTAAALLRRESRPAT